MTTPLEISRKIDVTVASGPFSPHSPSMRELTVQNVRDYLVGASRVPADEPVDVAPLAGGVSNVVFLVTPRSQEPFVLKQSRRQLRTQADWFSRLDRIFREVEAQRCLSRVLPPGAVPSVLFEDRDNYCYAMSAVCPDHVVWKRQLLSGQIDGGTFVRAGALLGDIHAQTAGQPQILTNAADTTVFHELRVDPFYRRIAAVHPQIQPSIDQLIADMAENPCCLVHADFSPKNLLIHPDGLTLVDHETVHYGDPAFDLGFFFAHLWLKAVASPATRSQIVQGIRTAWKSYLARWNDVREPPAIRMEKLSPRSVLHLAACLLSRVDGKSPVDYLTDPRHQAFVRDLSLMWFVSPPNDFPDAFQRLEDELTKSGI